MFLALLLACGASTPEARLAEALARVGEAPDEAATSLDGLCEEGMIDACAARATLDAGSVDAVRAAAERACEASVPAACRVRSEAPGDRWAQAACAAGDGEACMAVAAAQPAEAGRWLAQACHLEVPSACLPAAVAAWRGEEVARAVALVDRRCQQRGDADVACTVATRWRAARDAAEACGAGDASACRRACEAGHAASCEAAVPSLEAACAAGDGAACRRVALAGSTGVAPALWVACDEVAEVDPWACLLLADRVEAGDPLPAAARGDVAWLRNQACDLQLDYGCVAH